MLLIIFERHIVSRFHIHHHMRETRLKVLELEESLGNAYFHVLVAPKLLSENIAWRSCSGFRLDDIFYDFLFLFPTMKGKWEMLYYECGKCLRSRSMFKKHWKIQQVTRVIFGCIYIGRCSVWFRIWWHDPQKWLSAWDYNQCANVTPTLSAHYTVVPRMGPITHLKRRAVLCAQY